MSSSYHLSKFTDSVAADAIRLILLHVDTRISSSYFHCTIYLYIPLTQFVGTRHVSFIMTLLLHVSIFVLHPSISHVSEVGGVHYDSKLLEYD
jgi:hypothetical protein